MKKKRFSIEQIVAVLKQIHQSPEKSGSSISPTARLISPVCHKIYVTPYGLTTMLRKGSQATSGR
ncbi:hypothetical protein SAMN05216315_10849 [Nitrosospira sp. Nsp18]|nr:hypothetical protein SAMN05216315_10849 [Nitrosospira sp. Nsp18]